MGLIDCEKATNGKVWKVIGIVMVGALTAGLVYNLPDIKRYIKIMMM